MVLSAPKIKSLDEDLINKIAAGEVVERPASVIKELVENSLDAGATRIIVSIRDGGKKLIQVADDGCGISPNDLPLAIARHATSKITVFDDIYRLSTKGFRGEALASIASVSQLSLASHAVGFEPHAIEVHGGVTSSVHPAAQAPGTTVTVKHLFYQTPARLKFLRSSATETSHIVDVVTKLALSHPAVEFQVLAEDRELFTAPIFTDVKDRVTAILGKDLQDMIYPFSGAEPGLSVHGFFGHPQIARSQRSGVYFFVNSRAVNDKVLWHASLEAYRDLLMKGKYPVLILNLSVDENTIDVNVHPAKSEIRFHHSQQIHAFVRHVLRAHLTRSPWLERKVATFSGPAVVTDIFESNSVVVGAGSTESYLETSSQITPARDSTHMRSSLQNWSNKFFSGTSNTSTRPAQTYSTQRPEPQRHIEFGKTPYSDMRPLGQLLGTYILCEARDKLVLIDQHAAHERVGFEKLLLAFQKDGVPSELLLVPETFDLKPSDAEIFKNYLDELTRFGLEIDFFGGNTFVIKAVPALLKGKADLRRIIDDILDDVKETGEIVALKDRLHHVLATMACHAQIRAHHHLTGDEMTALLNELEQYQFTDFCPHGRPVSVEVTLEEIEKWFRRTL